MYYVFLCAAFGIINDDVMLVAVCCASATMSSSQQQNYSDGSLYVGEWNSEGQKHGRGRLSYSNKTEYTGQFECGLHSGAGVLVILDTSNKYGVVATLSL